MLVVHVLIAVNGALVCRSITIDDLIKPDKRHISGKLASLASFAHYEETLGDTPDGTARCLVTLPLSAP